ncbi:hypothetical protein L2E82_35577 [Cichorium intybus]|uniref:Uncharacterized protein n=1 Tax=Cichorium intybus TaxID=13427 RepID=A0ACB9BPF0_CICIN|nr:hypothetical protein L2E82_35577 [Cichorium intybus]
MLFLVRSIPSALSKSDSSIVDTNIAISGVANEFGTIWHVQYHSTIYDDPLAEDSWGRPKKQSEGQS